MIRVLIISLVIILLPSQILSQRKEKQNTYAGFVIKALTPNQIFRTKQIALADSINQTFSVKNKPSYGIGMNIRKNISKTWAVEGGIFYIKRSLEFETVNNVTDLSFKNSFDMISYEVPFHALMYIPFSKKVYSSAGVGFALNFLATEEYEAGDTLAFTFARRTSWIKPSVSMSYGVEFRGAESGFLYTGFSYQVFFSDIYVAKSSSSKAFFDPILTSYPGSYFSFDVKWFFKED